MQRKEQPDITNKTLFYVRFLSKNFGEFKARKITEKHQEVKTVETLMLMLLESAMQLN